jgi:hypothetical protein
MRTCGCNLAFTPIREVNYSTLVIVLEDLGFNWAHIIWCQSRASRHEFE